MDTISIVLVSILAIGSMIMVILLSSYVIKERRETKSQINKLNEMRDKIDFLVCVHMEDEKLNEIRKKYPDLTGVIRDYQKARNDYFGVGDGQESSEREN